MLSKIHYGGTCITAICIIALNIIISRNFWHRTITIISAHRATALTIICITNARSITATQVILSALSLSASYWRIAFCLSLWLLLWRRSIRLLNGAICLCFVIVSISIFLFWSLCLLCRCIGLFPVRFTIRIRARFHIFILYLLLWIRSISLISLFRYHYLIN